MLKAVIIGLVVIALAAGGYAVLKGSSSTPKATAAPTAAKQSPSPAATAAPAPATTAPTSSGGSTAQPSSSSTPAYSY